LTLIDNTCNDVLFLIYYIAVLIAVCIKYIYSNYYCKQIGWANKMAGNINDFLILITICCVALFFICYKHRHLAWTILDSNSLWDTLHLHTLSLSLVIGIIRKYQISRTKWRHRSRLRHFVCWPVFSSILFHKYSPSCSANYIITLPILSLTLRHYMLISFVSQFIYQLYGTLIITRWKRKLIFK